MDGAYQESSNAIGIDGNANDNSATDSGAVYIYTRDSMTMEWSPILSEAGAVYVY